MPHIRTFCVMGGVLAALALATGAGAAPTWAPC
jgi:hypothetical protein